MCSDSDSLTARIYRAGEQSGLKTPESVAAVRRIFFSLSEVVASPLTLR